MSIVFSFEKANILHESFFNQKIKKSLAFDRILTIPSLFMTKIFPMVQIIKTFTNLGLIGHEIHIEADSSKALPTIEIIGLADIMIKEAKERIRGTFRNCSIRLPNLKFILNLAPSDIRKVGTSFDVPMALALLLLVQEGRIQHRDEIKT